MAIEKQDAADDAAINNRDINVAAEFAKIEAMGHDDPKKPFELERLNAMRYDQAAALMMRSMRRDDTQGLNRKLNNL